MSIEEEHREIYRNSVFDEYNHVIAVVTAAHGGLPDKGTVTLTLELTGHMGEVHLTMFPVEAERMIAGIQAGMRALSNVRQPEPPASSGRNRPRFGRTRKAD